MNKEKVISLFRVTYMLDNTGISISITLSNNMKFIIDKVKSKELESEANRLLGGKRPKKPKKTTKKHKKQSFVLPKEIKDLNREYYRKLREL